MPSKRRSTSARKGADKKRKAADEVDREGVEEAALGSAGIGGSSAGNAAPVAPSSAVEVADADGRGKGKGRGRASVEIGDDSESKFMGEPVPVEEARKLWPYRFQTKKNGQGLQNSKSFEGSDEFMQAKRHFSQALVDGVIYNLKDDAYVQGEDGKPHYICKIVEMFEGVDANYYFRAQWFYRAQDTVIENSFKVRETKRVFFSEVQDDNPLDCLVQKLRIIKLTANIDLDTKMKSIPDCDYYYDMLYLVPYSSFIHVSTDSEDAAVSSESTISSDLSVEGASSCAAKTEGNGTTQQTSEMRLLDLYSGCGAMSTGLCLGANIYGVNLVTKWAIDFNNFACECLKLNHPETEVRNETVEDFLTLLKEWEKLCVHFSLKPGNEKYEALQDLPIEEDDDGEDDEDDGEEDPEVFEVEKILAICYGDPKEISKPGLYMKVRWRNYGPEEDTWEPIEGLTGSMERIKEFVISGFNAKMLPLPGDVDAICGGPPCQGISGFNRFRNKENPLDDPKNKQLKVYMDVVDYLKPKFVLMENVVDMVKFSGGFLGRYALGRLVDMNYQARLGIMAAGSYGLPQCRMRVFLWGARPTEKLPQYALPTHDLVYRGVVPTEFDKIVVAYDEGQAPKLKPKLFLEDAISDLPEVTNYEKREKMSYGTKPKTEFQHFIRLTRDAILGLEADPSKIFTPTLNDHQPLLLNEDDYQRVCRIPKKKGANFRDLPGVRVRPDNKVEWDPNVERQYLPSKKPVVPDYAMTFVGGSSSKPFGRLWWDETVPTVVTRAEPHNQAILHPVQDRVLSIRENARLQGFPDYYKLCGPIKQRYMQVGNAVAVPVARALGFGMAKASRGEVDGKPVFSLPPDFPKVSTQERASPASSQDQTVN